MQRSIAQFGQKRKKVKAFGEDRAAPSSAGSSFGIAVNFPSVPVGFVAHNAVCALHAGIPGNADGEAGKSVAAADGAFVDRIADILAEVKDDCVVVKDAKTGELSEIKADTVLLAMGIKPRFDVVDSLRHCAPESNVAIVGDCNNKAGTISEAVNQAFQACIHI